MQIVRPDSKKIIAYLNTHSFTIEPIGGIVLATVSGFATMLLFMMITQNVVVGMIGLLAGMGFIFIKKTGRAEYILTERGIYQFVSPFIEGALGFKTISRFFSYQSIYNYSTQEDMDRSLKQFKKLTLNLSVTPNKIILTDKKNPEQFQKFLTEFAKLVQEKNSTNNKSSRARQQMQQTKEPHIIKKKKSFYETAFAKVLAVFFFIVTLAFLYLSFIGFLNTRNSFRLYALVIPGTIFMLWKTFKKKHSETDD